MDKKIFSQIFIPETLVKKETRIKFDSIHFPVGLHLHCYPSKT